MLVGGFSLLFSGPAEVLYAQQLELLRDLRLLFFFVGGSGMTATAPPCLLADTVPWEAAWPNMYCLVPSVFLFRAC